MQLRLATAVLALGASLALPACITSPNNGSTVAGSVIGKQISFGGYYNQPSALVRLQVMTSPTLDPALGSSWVEFATATTSTNPNYINSTDPLYAWSVTAIPVPNLAVASRWPQGGLVKIRALVTSGSTTTSLVTFDEITWGSCLGEHLVNNASWSDIGLECAGTAGNHLAVVSTSNVPVLPGGPGAFNPNGFLGRKGTISAAETLEYYTATSAPTTLAAWKSRYGFPNADELTATYYNNGDLGLGREMHCRAYVRNLFTFGFGCYVTNYSGAVNGGGQGIPAFNVSPTTVLADAVARQHSFATVAMTYEPSAATNPVKFVVYDAAGARVNTAQLDSTSNNIAIPNNCLACHGINANYNSSTNQIVGDVHFLPFDPFSFRFSSTPGFTLGDQQESLRKLNALVLQTAPSQAISDFVAGLYAPSTVTTVGATASDNYVPPEWDDTLSAKAVYRGVVKVACRTCHMSASNPSLDFEEYDDFANLASLIRSDACTSHVMPHAERVMKNFWESGARAYLVAEFPPTYPSAQAACAP